MSSKITTISENTNYTAINIGKLKDLGQYEHGKVFLKDALKAIGCEISFTVVQPGQRGPFFHLHKTHEEIYMVISGRGEIQVDDNIIPIEEGSMIRVGCGGSHDLKNTGSEPLIYICAQNNGTPFTDPMADAEITQTPPKFT